MMTGRHDYQAGNPTQVGVREVINRISGEGLPVRLTNWPQRVVSDDLPVEEWPTGELPRITRFIDPTESLVWQGREAFVVSDCGTCLNIDHHAELRIVVVDTTVELRCHGTELELDAASLDRLIECGDRAAYRLSTQTDTLFSNDRAVSTWVACDSRTPLLWDIKGGTMEVHWGPAVVSVTGAALPELLRRARLAQTELDRRLRAPGDDDDPPDLIIPAAHASPGHATTDSARITRPDDPDVAAHPTGPQGRTWTTDDLEEILRGEGYDCDDAARLLREYAEPHLADVVTQLEEWADQIRPYLATTLRSSVGES